MTEIPSPISDQELKIPLIDKKAQKTKDEIPRPDFPIRSKEIKAKTTEESFDDYINNKHHDNFIREHTGFVLGKRPEFPELHERLTQHSFKIGDSLRDTINKSLELYNEIFPARTIDGLKVISFQYRKYLDFMRNAESKLKNPEVKNKEEFVEKYILEIEKQDSDYKNTLNEIKELAKQLKESYGIKKDNFLEKLQQKFEKIIYGQESVSLPEGFFADLENKINNPEKEKIPSQEPLYFPVGISKDLKSWEKVLNGEIKMAKPIDIYGYLFWLNNQCHDQNRTAQLVVCDEIQALNYQNLHKEILDQKPAEDWARKIGQEERKFYQEIIDTFGLTNIKLVDYQEFKKGSEKYFGFCTKLSQNSVFKKVFLAMIPDSVPVGEKEKHLPYAIEELSWILAKNGTKISHQNEASYDTLATVIKYCQIYGGKIGLEEKIFDESNSSELKKVINLINKSLEQWFGFLKADKRISNESSYYSNVLKSFDLLLDKKDKKQISKKERNDFNRQVGFEFNFWEPNVDAQSFGFNKAGETEKSTSGFKEPYSTEYYENLTEMFINSNQVVAVPKGHIGGKILTLSQDKQLKYSKEVLMPLLIQFFKTIKHAPQEYYDKIGKTNPNIGESYQELLNECQSCSTLIELLEFFKKFGVAPSHSG